jgi:sulfate transport system ATP-binding protein
MLALVQHVNAAGSVAKVQLSMPHDGADLAVEVSQERLAELALKNGDQVYVSPRRARVFWSDYSI